METRRETYRRLRDEMGHPIIVRDFETWQDVKAYGTFELGNKDDSYWSWDGKLYELCFRELPDSVKDEVIDAYSLI